VGELSLGYSQMTCVASLKEHCAQNRFQKLTTTSIVDDGKKKEWKGRGRKDDQFIRDTINCGFHRVQQCLYKTCNLPY